VETAHTLVHEILSRNFLPHAPAAKTAFTDMTIGEL
jgi:hypothetical protein